MLAETNLASLSGFVWWAGVLCGSTVVALGEWLTSKKGGSSRRVVDDSFELNSKFCIFLAFQSVRFRITQLWIQ
jgi:hypothetical protein